MRACLRKQGETPALLVAVRALSAAERKEGEGEERLKGLLPLQPSRDLVVFRAQEQTAWRIIAVRATGKIPVPGEVEGREGE